MYHLSHSVVILYRGLATEEYFTQVIKDIGDCIWDTSKKDTKKTEKIPSTNNDKFTDLKLICKDGIVRCHQAVLAHHSFFIRSILLRRHVLEFGSNIDWKEASAYLCDRRKVDDDAVILVHDFDCETISRMLSCFYTGIL